jgi:XTP/dITP diphosphohydrolase
MISCRSPAPGSPSCTGYKPSRLARSGREVPPDVVLLATRSSGKLRELRPLFEAAGIRAVDLIGAGLPPEPDEELLECFETFEENAVAKARYFFARAGLPAVADDSGLEVTALGGAPGVRSKRWSGRTDLTGEALDAANNARLLSALEHDNDRRARYVCVAAYVDGTGELTARGESAGQILHAARGNGGFGYDSLFLSDELGLSFGEVDGATKAAVSHRGRAFRQLLARLAAGR